MVSKYSIELRNACKTFLLGEIEVPALRNADLKIGKGDFVSIIGPSGSGKSTMLNLIGALDRPTKGNILIDGKDISHMDPSELAVIRGQKIGFVFQTFNLIPRLNALENVMLPMWFAGMDADERKERAIELLEMVGLGERLVNLPSQLSGGERQRVAMARALANEPEIIVADEPTGNLDSKTGKEIIEILKEIHENGATLILVTHDLDVARTAKKQVHLKDGIIIRNA